MKKLVLGIPALFLLSTICLSQPTLAGPVPETSQTTFAKDVIEANRPVVVDFFATWCGPCRSMEPVLNSLSQSYAGKANFVRVDVDKNPDLAEKFNINGIPAIMIFEKGKVVDSSVGAVPEKQLSKRIAAAVSQSKSDKSLAKSGEVQ